MKTKNSSLFILFAGTALLVLLDQVTKWAAQAFLKGQDAFPLLKGVFELYYLENRGSAFGLLQGKRVFFVIMAVFILIVVPYIYAKIPLDKHFRYLHIVAILFLSGAVGNAIDRVFHGYVIDFFYFSLIDFPVFNVADIYVTVGTAAFMFLLLFYYREEDLAQIELLRKKK